MTVDPSDRTGQLVFGEGRMQLVFVVQPVEKAAAQALGAYLSRKTFVVPPGSPHFSELSESRRVSLHKIYDDFPSPQQKLVYPSASITPVGQVEHEGSFTPSAREETYDPQAGTMVWNLGEVTGLLQLDIWADSPAEADAFYGRLPALFSPAESVSGLHLFAPPGYLSAPIRYLLVGRERRDTPDSVYANEKRVSATIRFDAPDLDLRCAKVMDVRATTTVLEPGS